MVVDLGFELSYLLSDALGRRVEVQGYSFDPGKALLCIDALVEGRGPRKACIEVKPCRGLREEARWARCVSKTLVHASGLVERLAGLLEG
ncbi:hypothetical protein CF15_01320 [Pyrodictium occultum]|uniref:Uncharacterized protein n=1 Tax=Pyrodictium occultum TaxID=2309 RepID=A0A0V8RTX7_PYROC|nr:hypothetical protein [Pyrodictium occultum]KSW11510.1 hypothetical protein CF15_01320 [Pyrodictium occultum]